MKNNRCSHHHQTLSATAGEDLSEGGKIAVAAFATAVASAILFFIIGFVSGLFCRKQRILATENITPIATKLNTIPIYEDVQELSKDGEQQLEMKENEAYGQVSKKLTLKVKKNEAYGKVE